jgi:hypothetical protein
MLAVEDKELATYYVIRKVGEPEYVFPYQHRGNTGVLACHCRQEPPRLFTTKGGARRALTWWLKGIVTVSNYDEYGGGDWHTVACPGRHRKDYEVVPVRMTTIEEVV